MTDHTTPPSNRPVSVVRAGGDALAVAEELLRGRSGPSIDLRGGAARPVLVDAVRRLAEELAAEDAEALARRHIEQAAALEAAVEAAIEARRVADAAVAARQAEHRRLVEGIAWCEERQLVVEELLEAVVAAEAAEDEAQSRLAAADAKLAAVTEQRAAAEGVLGEARRQLAELEVAGSGEHDLRRGLEEAHQEVRDAEAAADAARAEVERANAAAAGAEARLVELEETLAVLRAVAAGDPAEVAAALARFEAAEVVAPSWQVLDLADQLEALEATADAGPLEVDPRELADAEAVAAEAKAALGALLRPAGPRATPAWWDDLARLHAEVVDAEAGAESAGPIARKGALRRLEEARVAERAFLDELGYPSHLDALMSGGRPHGEARDQTAVVAATEAVEAAEAALAGAMARAAKAAQRRQVAAELDRLRAEAAAIVGLPADGITADRLRRPRPDAGAAIDLAAAMGVVDAPDHLLPMLARTWLAEHEGAADGLAVAEAEHAEATAEVTREGAVAADAEAAIATHESAARDARRRVEVLEAELGNRVGPVTDPATRAATAAALRDRIDALESRVGTAEAEAAEERAGAATAVAEATAALAAAQRSVTDTAARLAALVSLVDRAPERSGDLATDLGAAATALRAAADGLGALVEADAGAAVEAGHAVESARTDLDRHRATPPGSSPEEAVLEALRRTLEPGQRPSDVVVEPLELADDDEARAAVLDIVVAAGRQRPLVVVTDDPQLLGWAIELPTDVGGLVPKDALQSEAAAADEASDPAAATARRAD